jgi:hypothetical protein
VHASPAGGLSARLATGRPRPRPSLRARRAAWLKPRSRRRVTWSGTGTRTASGAKG